MTIPTYLLIAFISSVIVIVSIKGNKTASEDPVLAVIVAMIYGLLWPLGYVYSFLFNVNRLINPKNQQ